MSGNLSNDSLMLQSSKECSSDSLQDSTCTDSIVFQSPDEIRFDVEIFNRQLQADEADHTGGTTKRKSSASPVSLKSINPEAMEITSEVDHAVIEGMKCIETMERSDLFDNGVQQTKETETIKTNSPGNEHENQECDNSLDGFQLSSISSASIAMPDRIVPCVPPTSNQAARDWASDVRDSVNGESITISTQCVFSNSSQPAFTPQHKIGENSNQKPTEALSIKSPSSTAKLRQDVIRRNLQSPGRASPAEKNPKGRESLLDFLHLESALANGISSPKFPNRLVDSPHQKAASSVLGKDGSPTTITPKKLDIELNSPEVSRRRSGKIGRNEQRRRESAQCNAWLSSLPSSGGRLHENRLEQLEEDGPSLELADAAGEGALANSSIQGADPQSRAKHVAPPPRRSVCKLPGKEGLPFKSAAAAAAAAFLKKSDTPTRMRLPSPRICTETLWLQPPSSLTQSAARPLTCSAHVENAQQDCNESIGFEGEGRHVVCAGGSVSADAACEIRLATGRTVALESSTEGLMEQLRQMRVLRDDCILSASDYDLLHAAILSALAALSHREPPVGSSAEPASSASAPATTPSTLRTLGGVAARKSDALHGVPPSRPAAPASGDSTPARPTARPSSSGTPRVPARASTGSAARPSTPVRSATQRSAAQRCASQPAPHPHPRDSADI
jgi:hypothetical protein